MLGFLSFFLCSFVCLYAGFSFLLSLFACLFVCSGVVVCLLACLFDSQVPRLTSVKSARV